METITEKRVSNRRYYEGPITFSFYNADKFYEGRVVNYCKDGMCFKCGFAVNEGVDVYIRMINYPGEDMDPEALEGLRTVALAVVKWVCKDESDATGEYHIGVKYYVPEY